MGFGVHNKSLVDHEKGPKFYIPSEDLSVGRHSILKGWRAYFAQPGGPIRIQVGGSKV